ncbi:MAG: hypothetical protein M3457_08110 [Chloroflexota bacterium]|nr:hypothetical protein [Chloroflexota bacterium]
MRRRGCLLAVGSVLGLLLLCCVIGWFVGIPRLRDTVSDGISEELSTQIASQLDDVPGDLDPGTYTLSVADLRSQIDANLDSSTASDFDISVDPQGIAINFESNNQQIGYSGVPVARDGELVIEDMTVDNDVLGWILPADRAAGIIEDSVNSYFAARDLEIQSVELGNDEITFTTVPATSE